MAEHLLINITKLSLARRLIIRYDTGVDTVPAIPILRKTILVVEDNIYVRDALVQSLQIEGFTLLQAADGRAALNIMHRLTPDIILSDIEMPQIDGIQLYKLIRGNPAWVTIPFIFLTSHDSPELIQKGRELGVEDYLIKPVHAEELVKVINSRLLRAAEVQIAHIDQAYLETINVLANTIEGRDHNTGGHVERVTAYARRLALALKWPPENLRMLEFGSRLHDIGKITVPDQILNKPGPLTPGEWEIMKNHTLAGAQILRGIHHLQGAIPYILYHHERWNGSGYPRGLRGKEIPLEGRLLAIADVYDALTNPRPYHPARPQQEVLKFLKMQAGVLFDSDLVDTYLAVILHRNGNRG